MLGLLKNAFFASIPVKFISSKTENKRIEFWLQQARPELGQALLKLGLGFTSIDLNQIIQQDTVFKYCIVRLHSELANQTELQLDGVGVDFVFPPSQVTK